ncbi:MAG: NAD-dependent epimerase/dehydratase family protein [bacterium]
MGRVLVLGGTGFIGHHIVHQLLKRGEQVSVLARPTSDRSLLRGVDVRIVEGDLDRSGMLEDALEGADALVHAAGYYPIWSFDKSKQVHLGLKQIGRIHKALARRNVRRFLYVSSMSAVGRYEDGRPEDENAPFPSERYRSTYSSIKRAMQDEVFSQASRFNSVVVAPTGVFGEGDRKPTTGRVVLDVARGRLPVALRGRMNAVDVHSVAWGVVEALARGRSGGLYVLGGENVTIEGFLARVARIAEVPPPRFALPPQVVLPFAWKTEVIGKLLRSKAPLLPVVGIDFARFGCFISSEVAAREFDYNPTAASIDDVIRRTLAWFIDHGYLAGRKIES